MSDIGTWRRSVPRAVAAGLVALLVCGSAVSAAALTGERTKRMALTPCAAGGLVTWLNTSGSGALGTIYYDVEFTNLSGHTCTLRGYPGISGISLSGAQLGSAAGRTSTTPVRTITLQAGKTAVAMLGIVEVGNFPAAKCHPTTAAGLRVYAPNQTASRTVPYPFGACAKAGETYLFVQAVKAA